MTSRPRTIALILVAGLTIRTVYAARPNQGGTVGIPVIKSQHEAIFKVLNGTGYPRLESKLVAGHVFDTSFTTNAAGVSFDVRDRGGVIKGYVGIADGEVSGQQRWSFEVDGAVVAHGETESGDPATPVRINIQGAHALKIKLSEASFFDPIWYPEGDPSPANPSPTAKPKPLLLSPKENATVRGNNVELQWAPVPGAQSYGVTIVAMEFADSADPKTSRIWAATVTANSYDLDLTQLPKGKYLWSVVGFGSKKAIGTYSTERLLNRN